MLAILLLMTGHFAGSVYVRPFLEQVTLLETTPIALALLGFGVASVIGNVLGAGWLTPVSASRSSLPPL